MLYCTSEIALPCLSCHPSSFLSLYFSSLSSSLKDIHIHIHITFLFHSTSFFFPYLITSYHSHGGAEGRERIRTYEFYYPEHTTNGIYKFNVLLTTYNILMTDLDVLQDIHWKYMIVDEAQRAKSQNTKLFSALRQIRADAKLLLTGTPLQVSYQP